MIFGASRPRRPRNSTRPGRDTFEPDDSTQVLPPKLIPTLKQFASTAASIVHTRLALVSLEFEEEMHRLISAAIMGVVALILASLALVVGTFTIIAAVPVEYRVPTMIAVTVAYLVVAAILVFRVKGLFTDRPPVFGATLAEFEKDKDALARMANARESDDTTTVRRAADDGDIRPHRTSESEPVARSSAQGVH